MLSGGGKVRLAAAMGKPSRAYKFAKRDPDAAPIYQVIFTRGGNAAMTEWARKYCRGAEVAVVVGDRAEVNSAFPLEVRFFVLTWQIYA